MSETFYVELDGDTHTVTADGDEFECDCGAQGLADGYLADQSGAERWHRDMWTS